jgi:hypothetical protein
MISIQRHKVPVFARVPRIEPISLVCIHATRGANVMGVQYQATVNWMTNPPNLGGFAPACDVVIGAKGEVGEFFRVIDGVESDWRTSHATWAAGYGNGNVSEWGVDEVALSIEMAQPAGLDANGRYTNDPRATYEPFTQASIDALVEFLVQRFGWGMLPNVKLQHVDFLDQRRDWKPPQGFVGHDRTENGVKLGKSDPGPLFPINEVLTRVRDALAPPPPPVVDHKKRALELVEELEKEIEAIP